MKPVFEKIKKLFFLIFSPKAFILYFGLLTIISIILKFHKISIHSLWVDELFSVVHSSNAKNITELLYNIKSDVHPPGYQIFLYYWIKCFGNSELSVRLPSAIANMLLIIVSGLLFYFRIEKDKIKTLSLMAGISTIAILFWYGQEARSNSLMASVGIIAFILSILFNEDKYKNPYILIPFLSIFIFLSAWLHYVGLIWVLSIISVSFLYTILKKNTKKAGYWTLIGILTLISYLPWYFFSIATREIQPMPHIPPRGIRYLLELFIEFFAVGAIILFPLLLIVTYREFRFKFKNKIFFYEIAIIAVFFIVLFALQEFANMPMLKDRNIIVIAPAIMFLFCLKTDFENAKTNAIFLTFLTFAFYLQTYQFAKYTKKMRTKENFRAAALKALEWKTLPENAGIYMVSNRSLNYNYYLPNEMIEKCEVGKNFQPKPISVNRIMYVWGHLDDEYSASDSTHCLFPDYKIEIQEKYLKAGVVILKK